MHYTLLFLLVSAGLFGLTLLAVEIGRRLGRRHVAAQPDVETGTGVVDGAVFALLGLLIAFTFSGAASRFDDRRQLIISETNAIGTAYLRLQLVPPEPRRELQEDFRRYVDARIAVYRSLPDLDAARAELERSLGIQREIWQLAVPSAMAAPAPAAILLLPSLNTMFDLANERTLVTQIHPPLTIFVMLGALVLVSGLFAGRGMAKGTRSWMHVLGLAATLAVTVFVILDLEYPRLGAIRLDRFDRALVELRQAMQ